MCPRSVILIRGLLIASVLFFSLPQTGYATHPSLPFHVSFLSEAFTLPGTSGIQYILPDTAGRNHTIAPISGIYTSPGEQRLREEDMQFVQEEIRKQNEQGGKDHVIGDVLKSHDSKLESFCLFSKFSAKSYIHVSGEDYPENLLVRYVIIPDDRNDPDAPLTWVYESSDEETWPEGSHYAWNSSAYKGWTRKVWVVRQSLHDAINEGKEWALARRVHEQTHLTQSNPDSQAAFGEQVQDFLGNEMEAVLSELAYWYTFLKTWNNPTLLQEKIKVDKSPSHEDFIWEVIELALGCACTPLFDADGNLNKQHQAVPRIIQYVRQVFPSYYVQKLLKWKAQTLPASASEPPIPSVKGYPTLHHAQWIADQNLFYAWASSSPKTWRLIRFNREGENTEVVVTQNAPSNKSDFKVQEWVMHHGAPYWIIQYDLEKNATGKNTIRRYTRAALYTVANRRVKLMNEISLGVRNLFSAGDRLLMRIPAENRGDFVGVLNTKKKNSRIENLLPDAIVHDFHRFVVRPDGVCAEFWATIGHPTAPAEKMSEYDWVLLQQEIAKTQADLSKVILYRITDNGLEIVSPEGSQASYAAA